MVRQQSANTSPPEGLELFPSSEAKQSSTSDSHKKSYNPSQDPEYSDIPNACLSQAVRYLCSSKSPGLSVFQVEHKMLPWDHFSCVRSPHTGSQGIPHPLQLHPGGASHIYSHSKLEVILFNTSGWEFFTLSNSALESKQADCSLEPPKVVSMLKSVCC